MFAKTQVDARVQALLNAIVPESGHSAALMLLQEKGWIIMEYSPEIYSVTSLADVRNPTLHVNVSEKGVRELSALSQSIA